MRTIITGSRTITDYKQLEAAVADSKLQITEVASRGTPGVDQLGEQWAHMCRLPLRRFRPGNEGAMIKYADALLLIVAAGEDEFDALLESAKAGGLRLHTYRVE